MYQSITLQFDGNLATNHQVALNELGKSLIGIDRIMNAGLIVMTHARLPKRGERFNLVVTASEPKPGSMDIITILAQTPGLLPLVHEFLISGGTEAVFRFVSYVMTRLGGRKQEAEVHYNAMLQMNRDHLEARNISDSQWQETLLTAVDKLAPQTRESVTPIGKTASTLAITAQDGALTTTIDEPMADAIRSKEDDEVGDTQNMTIKVDGIIHHSRQLKIEHPEIEGKYITAEVRDPVFDSFPNKYSEAAASLSELSVTAKPTYRNGELHKIYVMDTDDSNR